MVMFQGVSGQITMLPKPELRAFGGDTLTKPPFGVTLAAVASYNLPRNIVNVSTH